MKDNILKLKDGGKYIVPESDYGKAEVWKVNDVFVLFEIPQYGGTPIYFGTYYRKNIEMLIEQVNHWN